MQTDAIFLRISVMRCSCLQPQPQLHRLPPREDEQQ